MQDAARSRPGRDAVLERLLPAAAAAVVLVLGAIRVTDRPYWSDEAVTRFIVAKPWSELVVHLGSQEAGMGPYYVSLWVWRHVAESDSGLRWFSIVGGAVAAALLVRFALLRFGRFVAVASAIVLVTNPFFLRYLTELRAYSWVMAGSIASVLAIVAVVERPSVRRAVVAGLVVGLTVAVHAVFVLWVAAAFGAALAARPGARPSGRLVVAGTVASLAALAPFVPAMLARSDQIDWIPSTTPVRLAQVTQSAFGGATLAVVLGVGVVVLLATVLRGFRAGERPDHPTAVVFAMALAGPVLLAAASLLKPLLIVRYLAPALPFLCLASVVGWVIVGCALRDAGGDEPSRAGARGTIARSLGLVPVVAALAVFVVRDPMVDVARPEDPRAAAALVADLIGPGDRVLVDRPGAYGPLAVVPELERAGIDTVSQALADVGDRALVDAPTVFVIGWSPGGTEQLQPGTERLLAERTVERYEFGLTFVLVARR